MKTTIVKMSVAVGSNRPIALIRNTYPCGKSITKVVYIDNLLWS